jgi:hypothetical protein
LSAHRAAIPPAAPPVGQPDLGQQRHRGVARRGIGAAAARQAEQVGEQAGAFLQVPPGHDVLQRGHAEEDLQVLEGARQAHRRQAVRRRLRHVLPGQRDAAVGRAVEAGDDVEQRRLARAVRPDDRQDLARAGGEADAVERAQPAEGDADALRGQQHLAARGHAFLRSSAARPGTMPTRRKIMNSMMSRPSTACS